MSGTEEDMCNPNFEADFLTLCRYVQNHSDICEGGGYLLWTEMEVCTDSTLLQALTMVAAIIFFLLLFLHLSITADSFFSKNIASIVDLHKISQNIAGVTFMAFGNGAPDIFGSIVSVISVKKPRADLAISELLGGGIFVTTCVVASIALSGPCLLMRRPILRDIFFYLAAIALLIFVANQHQLQLWHALAFLLLYLIYALVVIFGNLLAQRMSNKRRMHRAIARLFPKKIAPVTEESVESAPGWQEAASSELVLTPSPENRRKSEQQSVLQLPGGILLIPVTEVENPEFHAKDCLEAGKFFGKEELDAESEDDSACPLPLSPSGDSSSSSSPVMPELERSEAMEEWCRFWRHICPVNVKKFRKANWLGRAYRIVKIPSMFCLKLTVPCIYEPWSKPLFALHAFMAPLTLDGLNGGELALLFASLLAICVVLFTSKQREPGCYKWVCSYAGFVVSIAWIYATAAEVLNVVLMFGNLFKIPHQILGLTAISWCNSIGDLIADISVARQGMSRMAFSAAFGAPLFNLLIGFGATFSIAKFQGKNVNIKIDTGIKLMFAFLCAALCLNLILFLVQRFYVRRCHGLILILLYLLFLFAVIFAQLRAFEI